MLHPMPTTGCCKYRADIVYSPEIIDRRLMRSQRIVNQELGTVDFIDDSGTLNLRVHPRERGHLVVQLGSSTPEYAAAAAKLVAGDVDGIDLNCGCPKKFSVSGGMGSALLEEPDLLESILRALVSSVSIPVTCKIRLLDAKDGKSSIERTIELMQRLEKTNIASIALHCRFRHERPRQPAHWDVFDDIAKAVSIPVIANGDMWTLDDMRRLKESHGARVSSFMFARGAQDNVSVFRREGPLPHWEVMKEYLRVSEECGANYYSIKYVLLQMWGDSAGIPFRQLLVLRKSIEEIKALFAEYDDVSGIVSPAVVEAVYAALRAKNKPKPNNNPNRKNKKHGADAGQADASQADLQYESPEMARKRANISPSDGAPDKTSETAETAEDGASVDLAPVPAPMLLASEIANLREHMPESIGQ
ncbi:tRNA-dihydrouridine synthase 2 [Polyrhizophydium stewartii]|uniref:tRNA-dihydrouridine synthase 2 n=1 Tax=Polyrhizophydium stewartii TaxID=2732419 RepID=A0ABR4NA75_9FUNG|nr:tRNA-dihydrouridine(20) synthase [NAD(P)+]-like [Polyrhizophydium stewartii]